MAYWNEREYFREPISQNTKTYNFRRNRPLLALRLFTSFFIIINAALNTKTYNFRKNRPILSQRLSISLLIIIFAALGYSSINTNNLFNEVEIDVQNSTCDPNQDCVKSGEKGIFVLDPENCHNFYVCVSINGEIMASDAPISCPNGQFFNPFSASCENETQPCTNTCEKRCHASCNSDFEFIPYPGNCSRYYNCASNEIIQCPEEIPYFNGIACTNNIDSCCDFCVTPYCPEKGVQIPDPCDCRKFYICIDIGSPSENVHSSCPENEIFDPVSGGCIKNESCNPQCPFCGTTSYSTTTISVYSTHISSIPPLNSNVSTQSSYTSQIPCLDEIICPEKGNFPRCPYCDESFFQCSEADILSNIRNCPNNTVFNTNLNYPYCLDLSSCPYPNKE